MRMLEKDPAARYGSVVEFCAALDAAMVEAELDASWDLPLCDPDAPENRTTEEDPALADANDSTRWLRRWLKEKHRRGRKPQEKLQALAQAPAPVAEVLAAVPEQKAPAVAVEPAPEPVPPPAPQSPAPLNAPRAAAAPPPPVSRHRSRLAAAAGLAVVMLGAFLLAKSLIPSGSDPLDTSSEATPARQAGPSREVAQSAKPLDPPGGEGAEPTMGSISAPVMITMLRKDDSSEKLQEKKTKVLGRAAKAISTGLVCKMLTGCPAPQVRPTPEPEPCPAGAVEAMANKLGVRVGQRVSAYLTQGPTGDITVREGSTSVELGPIGFKPGGGVFLSGTLTIGEERVYGRFTTARIKDGPPFPVCFELWDSFKGGRGAIHERNGGLDSARIYSSEDVMAVDKFE